MNNDKVPELDDLWREANEYFLHCEFNKAMEIYRYILIRYYDNSFANENANAHLGDVLLTLGQVDLAEGHIRKALSYDPENPHYHHLLGFVYCTRYDWRNMVKEYKLALEREPGNRDYLYALAMAVFNSGDRKTGLEHLLKVATLYSHDSGMLAQLATAYLSLGDIENAKLYTEKAVVTRADDIMALAVLKKTQAFENGTSQGQTN